MSAAGDAGLIPPGAAPTAAPAAAAPPPTATAAAEEDFPPISDLFVCREYAPKTYVFHPPPSAPPGAQPLAVTLDVLEAASTDFDLTGQIVWSVSVLLAQYVAFTARAEVLAAAAVLELGAGCGLAGLAAAALGCAEVLLTDNEPEVLQLLARSAARYPAARVLDLNWGDDGSHAALAAAVGGHAGGSHPQQQQQRRYSVLLGADVIFWSHAVPLLFDSVARLLAPGGVFLLAFTNRRNGLQAAAEAAARGVGLAWEEVDPRACLPDPAPPVFTQQLHLVTLYRMHWAAEGGGGGGSGGSGGSSGSGGSGGGSGSSGGGGVGGTGT
jgi:predicted nicotinamide N-methyase